MWLHLCNGSKRIFLNGQYNSQRSILGHVDKIRAIRWKACIWFGVISLYRHINTYICITGATFDTQSCPLSQDATLILIGWTITVFGLKRCRNLLNTAVTWEAAKGYSQVHVKALRNIWGCYCSQEKVTNTQEEMSKQAPWGVTLHVPECSGVQAGRRYRDVASCSFTISTSVVTSLTCQTCWTKPRPHIHGHLFFTNTAFFLCSLAFHAHADC